MPVRAVLFDAIGTLLVREGGGKAAHENAMRRALAVGDALVRLPPYAEFSAAYDRALDPPGVFRIEPKLQETLRSLGLKPRAQKELAKRMAERYWKEQGAALRLQPDALACLRALPDGLRLALVSNWPHGESMRAALDRLGIFYRFDALALSGEVGAEKPDPRLFLHALAELDVPPGDAVMVGDDLAGDLVPAKALGLRAALVPSARPVAGPVEPIPGIDLALASLVELPAALARMD